MSKNFSGVAVVDFEYETYATPLPDPLCMVAYLLDENLRLVRVVRLWRGEFGSSPPFDIDDNTLFVAYSAWAEMTCFKALSWRFPVHILDLHTAYLAASNILLPYEPAETRRKERKRLSDACRAYGIEGWEKIDKEEIAKAIGEGRWREYGKETVLDYCEEDVRNTAKLLRRMLLGSARFPPIDVPRTLWWSDYSAKACALIQARGIPWDAPLWNLVQENKEAIIRELIREFGPSADDDAPIYTPDGEFSYARFEAWLVRAGVPFWPRLKSGQLDLSGDAFKLMAYFPGIENLHALRDSIGFIAKARLPVDSDGRNRPSLFPLATASGRNAHARSPFNAHAAVRGFIRFAPDKIGVYLDWRQEEPGIAAALSGDQALMRDYLAGDVYYALAKLSGLTDDPDRTRWKRSNPDARQRMKSLQLAINYGMSVSSLARGLNRHPLIASFIIERHKRTYPRFWEWREEVVMSAMLSRRIESVFGWPLRLTTSPNKRALYNFPMQSNGAEMMRLATCRLCEAGIIPVMLVHDAVLLEVDDREQIEHAKEIMRAVGRDVCGALEIGVDVDQELIGGQRFADKREVAKRMWAKIMSVLEAIGAIRKQA